MNLNAVDLFVLAYGLYKPNKEKWQQNEYICQLIYIDARTKCNSDNSAFM